MVTIDYECTDGFVGSESFESKQEFVDWMTALKEDGKPGLTSESIDDAFKEFTLAGL